MPIKYFKVTSDRLHYPVYYAAYDLDAAKEVAYSDFNSQFLLNFEEVSLDDIPPTGIIRKARLSSEDARKFASRGE